jgi:hypothetical protein
VQLRASGQMSCRVWMMLLVMAGWTAAALAHHSIAMVDIGKPVWVTGTVVEYRVQHPHVIFTLEVKGADGKPMNMEVEGPNLARMKRIGADEHFMKAGDVLQVCGFPLKQPLAKPDFIHGEVLVMPGGQMRHWGPYGRLENCIRPGDSHEQWVKFLKEDPAALPAWCSSSTYVRVPSVAPPGFVAEVDRLMGNPCR